MIVLKMLGLGLVTSQGQHKLPEKKPQSFAME